MRAYRRFLLCTQQTTCHSNNKLALLPCLSHVYTECQFSRRLFSTELKAQATLDEQRDDEEVDAETKLWSELPVNAWKLSVLTEDSVFHELYLDTRRRLIEATQNYPYDVIVEVGCGTGEIISHLEEASVPRIGVDINEAFVQHCIKDYGHQKNLEFHVVDATELDSWWQRSGNADKYQRPLLVCPNNTIMIMPEGIREQVLDKMRAVAGANGRCCVTFWNKKMFAHGVMGFYKKNRALCGTFDLTDNHVDWDEGTIETNTSYKSKWLDADDVKRWMSSLLVNVEVLEPERRETGDHDTDHVAEHGMGVYLWLKGQSSVAAADRDSARDYYDSRDAQTFYSTVWGEHNTHIGRYDLVAADPELAKLPLQERIRVAQVLHEDYLVNFIDNFYEGAKVRCLDMGCGYGGFLRRMAQQGMLWSGFGVDISSEMVQAAQRLTDEMSGDDSDESIGETPIKFAAESYMHTSVQDEGVDLCVSMDAFLHVGPGQHDAILAEAWRVLRPGGRLIFTDIMCRPDAPAEAKLLYERIGLESFGTVQGYFEKAKTYGFGELHFEDHSENVTQHYGSVLSVLEDLWSQGKIDVSEQFKQHMAKGLVNWRDLSPKCLHWGIISMRKLEQSSN